MYVHNVLGHVEEVEIIHQGVAFTLRAARDDTGSAKLTFVVPPGVVDFGRRVEFGGIHVLSHGGEELQAKVEFAAEGDPFPDAPRVVISAPRGWRIGEWRSVTLADDGTGVAGG